MRSRFLRNHAHSRVPVGEETIDNVTGILNVRDLLRTLDKLDINTATLKILNSASR